MSDKIKVVTHGGHFHADDIFAVASLSLLLGEENIEIIRSRDMSIIDGADYVVDVGGTYNVNKKRFDHHQEGGAGVRGNSIPYSSFGLIWKTYGEQLCGNFEVANLIDIKLVQSVDALDNAVEFMETKIEGVSLYGISDFFEAFWPSWKEIESKPDSIFLDVVSISKKLLRRVIIKEKDKFEAEAIIKQNYDSSADKRLIIFDRYYPARKILSKFPEPLYAIYPGLDGEWMITTINDGKNTFGDRKSLPKSWAGKKDEEFENITGVFGATFCHSTRWLAGAKTKEAILRLAELALKD